MDEYAEIHNANPWASLAARWAAAQSPATLGYNAASCPTRAEFFWTRHSPGRPPLSHAYTRCRHVFIRTKIGMGSSTGDGASTDKSLGAVEPSNRRGRALIEPTPCRRLVSSSRTRRRRTELDLEHAPS